MSTLRNMLDGYGSVLDLMPNPQRRSKRFEKEMRTVMRRHPGDYAAILQDLRRSMFAHVDTLDDHDSGTRIKSKLESAPASRYEKSLGLSGSERSDRPTGEQLEFEFASDS